VSVRVLFVTNDNLSQRRAGPAVRAIELARVLARDHQVTVATAQPSDAEFAEFTLLDRAARRTNELKKLARASDVTITQGMVLARFPFVGKLARHLVVDLYDPYLLEYLAHPHPRHADWGELRQLYRINQQLLAGDFFLCANERQWDYWSGSLSALGRLNLPEHHKDPSFRRLLDVVPFGLASRPPQHSKQVMRGVMPGIGADDLVLLWAGGIWQWLDPLTVIRAVAAASQQIKNLRLVFLGTEDPNPQNRPMSMVEQSRHLASDLGVLDRHVFFRPGWTSYEERQNWLLEADIGVSAHQQTAEARFAFRTRVLDYIWAGLPMILTSGDYFSEWAERQNVGYAVAAGDVAGWQNAVVKLAAERAEREHIRARLLRLVPQFAWEQVAAPLARYCAAPYKTARVPLWRQRSVPFLAALYDFTRGRLR